MTYEGYPNGHAEQGAVLFFELGNLKRLRR